MLRYLLAAVALFTSLPTTAQEFPRRQPIRIVVAFNPGGLTDLLARITAEHLQRRIGQAVVVENRPGAAGAIALSYVARAPADGYTLMVTAADIAVLPALRSNLPYRLEDFTYITRFWNTGTMIVVAPQSPITSAQDLIAQLRSDPGRPRFGTTGVGSLNHLGTARFVGAVGGAGTHVPYAGAAPIYTDLLAGTIDFYTGASLPFPNTLRVLAPAGSRRSVAFPNLPTLEELGFPNASYDAWFGVIGPPNLPAQIVERLGAELRAVYQDPDSIARFRQMTGEIPEEAPLVGDAFRQRVLQENLTWKEIAERNRISVE